MAVLYRDINSFLELLSCNEDKILASFLADPNCFHPSSSEKTRRELIHQFIQLTGNAAASSGHENAELLSFGKQQAKTDEPLYSFFLFLKKVKAEVLNLIKTAGFSGPEYDFFLTFLNNCFDAVETGYVSELSKVHQDEPESFHKIREEKHRYKCIFEDFYSPVMVVSDDSRIININKAALKLFPFLKTGELLDYNERNEDSIHEEKERLEEFFKSSLNELSYETFIETDIGDRFFLIKFKKITGFNQSPGTLIIFDDLTERKEIEQQLEEAKTKAEETDRLKTAFLANMSHEIRTPMNAIIGFSDLLLMQDMSNDKKEYVQLIQKSGNNLLKLIDDLIDIAMIESKQMKIKKLNCHIQDLLKDLYMIFDELLKKEKKADVRLKLVSEDEKLMVLTDPDRLKQVFVNLISNAVKFTKSGTIEFGYKKMDDVNIIFYVKDTGIGIPKNKLNMIFDRFYQVEEFYTKHYGGTGLGLSISKNIIQLLGGTIWVESEQNSGSTFYFIIPNETGTVKKDHSHSNDLPDICMKHSWEKFTILIAEDEEINFYYLYEILRKTGVKIIWAKNGLKAINYAESDMNIDLVLMDIKMPEVNGIEAIKYIKSIRPGLPIVAQTAFVMDHDREICFKSGCIDFLSKPIKSTVLFEVIGKIFAREKIIK